MSQTSPMTQRPPATNLTGAQYSTYRIGGPIQEGYLPETLDEAVAALTLYHQRRQEDPNLKLTVLGWGGNSLIASRGISGITVITRKLVHIEPLGENRFRMEAGIHCAKVAATAQKHSLTGAEFMIGIPGTVGGAVRMNAGAIGQETSTIVERVLVFNLDTAELETWDKSRLAFDYRFCDLDPRRHIVLAADFQFRPGDLQAITEKMESNVHFRKTHHPTEPNGGSVFRNPGADPKFTVGRMIDELGGKSWVQGGVRISPLHGNFIINTGGGTSTDVLKLMLRMKQAVKEHYGFDIFPENKLLGDITEEEQELWKELTRGDHAHS